jgi:esterase/lipase superfamily enzyme
MNIEYHKWWSPCLNQDMELKVYGYHGKPVLVFPAQSGRFYDFENFDMVQAIAPFIEEGKIKVFTVDGIDDQTWANWDAHPADRAYRHLDYDHYIASEVAPFVDQHCNHSGQKILTTGVSMGGYHSANFFFRHPDIFDAVIAISGIYDLQMFVGDYSDENVYLNSPLAFLSNLDDPWYLEQFRRSQIIIAAGQGAWEDEMLQETLALKSVLEAKEIPAWVDIWGNDVNHDWPWWRKMLPYFLEKMDLNH